MKLKITEHNGALMVSVLGSRQELVISEEDGGFELELRERKEGLFWWDEPLHVEATADEEANPVAAPVKDEETNPVTLPSIEEETSPAIEEETNPVTLPVVEANSAMFTNPVTPQVIKEETNPATLPVVEPNSAMFTNLANLRREIASASKLPAYMVFHDKALWAMVEAMPQDLAAFGKISGVGQAKLEKYGEMFLAVINGAAA